MAQRLIAFGIDDKVGTHTKYNNYSVLPHTLLPIAHHQRLAPPLPQTSSHVLRDMKITWVYALLATVNLLVTGPYIVWQSRHALMLAVCIMGY